MPGVQSVKGLVTLVTGAASGLGKGTATRFAREGAKVVVADLPSSDGGKVATEIGGGAVFQPVDVTSKDDVRNALDAIRDKFGRLDVIVNCAGVTLVEKTYHYEANMPHRLQHFDNVLKVNSLGTFNVTRLGVGMMGTNAPNEDGQRGVIINTAGISAFEGQRGTVACAASCGAIVSMTLPLARDVASQGIRVCTIAPGFFTTSQTTATIPEAVRVSLARSIPFPKRFGGPDEFAHVVQFLVENPLMNGEVIRVDGAMRLQM